MTYNEAREFISDSNQYGSKLGLDTIIELLKRLGNPQDQLKVIHVAGTNGKGSTSAFIAGILAAQGYQVGRYHSPAVFNYLEMVQINRPLNQQRWSIELLAEQGVTKGIECIKPVCEEMVREGMSHPTSFEIETAMALLYLSWQNVDFAVIEVGLGGRLDATNVFRTPLLNVITSISMDHMQYLGDTLGQIAYEKAGIIKKGAKVITCNDNPEIIDVIRDVCKIYHNELILSDLGEVCDVQYLPEKTSFTYHGKQYEIGLLGEYQIKNAILAIDTVMQLSQSGYPVEERSIQSGLLYTVWSGRFEVIKKSPYFILDGAHNEEAALALRKSIMSYFPTQRKIFIIGVLADKDYKKILEVTADLADVVITLSPNNYRALASSQLAKEAKNYTNGKVIDASTAREAVDLALKQATHMDIVLSYGSLSYLGEIRSYVNHEDNN